MADRSDTRNTKSLSGKPGDKGANGQEIQDPTDLGSNDLDERISKQLATTIGYLGVQCANSKLSCSSGLQDSH
jgi:hypothetical protein